MPLSLQWSIGNMEKATELPIAPEGRGGKVSSLISTLLLPPQLQGMLTLLQRLFEGLTGVQHQWDVHHSMEACQTLWG